MNIYMSRKIFIKIVATYYNWPYSFNHQILKETSGPDGTQWQWKRERKILSTWDGTQQSGEIMVPISSTYKPGEKGMINISLEKNYPQYID